MRMVMRECLQEAGHYVAEATSGDEGWAYVRRKPIDLIVTDLFMPNVDGFAFIETVHREYPELKILVVSGAGGVDDPEHYLKLAKRMGANAVLAKPVRLQELAQTVDFLVGAGTRL